MDDHTSEGDIHSGCDIPGRRSSGIPTYLVKVGGYVREPVDTKKLR